ncbi:MAG: rhodanese-like domain-containing protein [Aquihabitans sp.]
MGEKQVDVPEIDIAETVKRRAEGAPVIDVREPEEYVEGHVSGAALIPMATVPERVAEIITDGPVLIICRSGARSRSAAEFLRTQGIDAMNVSGGTMEWIRAGHPVVTGAEAGARA